MISVIVPVFRVEQYLDRCVKSILNQSYSELEVILVDDGSPDNCPVLCDEWALKDSRIKVIHKTNGGLSDARNAGVSIARGDYIGFVDSDDWIAPEMYERLLKSIIQDKSDIAACSVKMIWEDGTPERLLTIKKNTILSRTEAQKALLYETDLKQPVWYKLYNKEVVKDIPFEKGKYHEDVFWSYQAIGRAERISIIDYEGYYYWQRKDSIMGEAFSLKRLDALDAVCQRYEYFSLNEPTLEDEAKLKILANCIYFGQLALKYMDKKEQASVFSNLYKVMKKYQVNRKLYKKQKVTHRIWYSLANVTLPGTCKLKNVLNVGY